MSVWYRMSPEVAGGLGEKTQMDADVHPPRVHRLHYVFSGWLGDDIVETFPCFLATERLASAISTSGLSGTQFGEVEVSLDPQFENFYPEIASSLPRWVWLRSTGSPGEDDFWLDEQARLHLSQGAYELLQRFHVANAEFTELIQDGQVVPWTTE